MVSRLVWIGKVGEMMVVENNVMRGTMRNDCIAAALIFRSIQAT